MSMFVALSSRHTDRGTFKLALAFVFLFLIIIVIIIISIVVVIISFIFTIQWCKSVIVLEAGQCSALWLKADLREALHERLQIALA